MKVEQLIDRLKTGIPDRKDFGIIEAVRDYDRGGNVYDLVDIIHEFPINKESIQMIVSVCREYDKGGPYARKGVAR